MKVEKAMPETSEDTRQGRQHLQFDSSSAFISAILSLNCLCFDHHDGYSISIPKQNTENMGRVFT